MQPFVAALPEGGVHAAAVGEYLAADADPLVVIDALRRLMQDLSARHLSTAAGIAGSTAFQTGVLLGFAEQARQLTATLDLAVRATLRLLDLAEKKIAARDDDL